MTGALQMRRDAQRLLARREMRGEGEGVCLKTKTVVLVGKLEEAFAVVPEARADRLPEFFAPLLEAGRAVLVAKRTCHRRRVPTALPEKDVHVRTVRGVAEVEVAGVLGGLGALDERAVLLGVRGEIVHQLHHLRIELARRLGIAGVKEVVVQHGNEPGGEFVGRERPPLALRRRRVALGVRARLHVPFRRLVETEKFHRPAHVRLVARIERIEDIAFRPPEVAAPDQPVAFRAVGHVRESAREVPVVQRMRTCGIWLPEVVPRTDLHADDDRPRLLFDGKADSLALLNRH